MKEDKPSTDYSEGAWKTRGYQSGKQYFLFLQLLLAIEEAAVGFKGHIVKPDRHITITKIGPDLYRGTSFSTIYDHSSMELSFRDLERGVEFKSRMLEQLYNDRQEVSDGPEDKAGE
jgi:hypothetical protein